MFKNEEATRERSKQALESGGALAGWLLMEMEAKRGIEDDGKTDSEKYADNKSNHDNNN